MGGVAKFLGGAILGGIIGAAAAVLLAPESGIMSQGKIGGRFGRIVDAGRSAAAEREKQLQAKYRASFRAEKQAKEPVS
jgi:gas vesicle protein